MNASTPIIFNPHPALYGIAPEPTHRPSVPASSYEELKNLDKLLDRGEDAIAEMRDAYQKTLKDFATLCHQLWERDKAQGSRQGKGFRSRLKEAGIKVGRAYRAMKKFFPADFTAQSKPRAPKALTSSAADEVRSTRSGNEVGRREPSESDMKDGLVSAASVPDVRFTGKSDNGGELLQCTFALTLQERSDFEKCLSLIDASQVQRLLLEAVKQAAIQARVAPAPSPVFPPVPSSVGTEEIKASQSEIANRVCPQSELAMNNDADCGGVSLVPASAAQSRKQQTEAELDRSRPRLRDAQLAENHEGEHSGAGLGMSHFTRDKQRPGDESP